MSLLPLFFDEHPAVSRRDWVSLFSPEEAILRPLTNVLNQLSNIEKDTSITFDKDKFQANVDVQQFKPEEVSVKITGDRTVTIEGKHEEQPDEHGFISRHFVRRYVLPEDSDVSKLQSKLSSDGVLSITAPKKPDTKQLQGKQIPIMRTGPIRKLTQKPKESDNA